MLGGVVVLGNEVALAVTAVDAQIGREFVVKAKVGLEAVRGVQTSNKISQEFGRGLACHDLYRKQIRMFHYPTYWDDFTIVA